MQANTEIVIDKKNLVIQPEDIDFRFDPDLNYIMLRYGDRYATGMGNHNPKIGVLFGVRDYIPHPTMDTIATGKSCRDTLQGRSYGFVFIQRIERLFGNRSEQNKKVLRTRTAIHEMGHVRRSKGTKPQWIGDEDQFFHNGKNKDSCIFKQQSVWTPEYAFKFCEGHEQIFLNINWDLEDYYYVQHNKRNKYFNNNNFNIILVQWNKCSKAKSKIRIRHNHFS